MLTVEHLTIEVADKAIVKDASFSLERGQILGLVGGSGSGKTTIGLSLMGLLGPALSQTNGRISADGKIGFIFQEPLHAFDPLFTVGDQLSEVPGANDQRVAEVLEQVQLGDPKRILASFPHQLSGGQRQRAMIAQALISSPAYLVADEPTSSMDVTLQAQIMALLRHLARDLDIGILLIAHDWGMVSHLAQHVLVLKEGSIVEQGDPRSLMKQAKHPYTQALIEAFE